MLSSRMLLHLSLTRCWAVGQPNVVASQSATCGCISCCPLHLSRCSYTLYFHLYQSPSRTNRFTHYHTILLSIKVCLTYAYACHTQLFGFRQGLPAPSPTRKSWRNGIFNGQRHAHGAVTKDHLACICAGIQLRVLFA